MPGLPWVALAFAVDHDTPGSVAAGLMLWAVTMILRSEWPAGHAEFKLLSPEPGVWITSPTRRLRRLVALLFPATGLACALAMAGASYWDGDALALVFDALIALGFVAVIGWDAWRGLGVQLEARIDDTGLYSHALGATIRWPQMVEILPRPRG